MTQMTQSDWADILWVAITVIATTSITQNIVGFRLNRTERMIEDLAKQMTEHTELLKRVARGEEK